jgi:hypothetical protein
MVVSTQPIYHVNNPSWLSTTRFAGGIFPTLGSYAGRGSAARQTADFSADQIRVSRVSSDQPAACSRPAGCLFG